MKLSKAEMEKKLAAFLDERWFVVTQYGSSEVNMVYYNGACKAIEQIGSWTRNEAGKHSVTLG